MKDGRFVVVLVVVVFIFFINILTSNNIVSAKQNIFRNGVDPLSKNKKGDAFLTKSLKFHLVRIFDNVQILLACGMNTY